MATLSLTTTSAALLNAFPISDVPTTAAAAHHHHRTAAFLHRPSSSSPSSSLSSSSTTAATATTTAPRRIVTCAVALRSESESSAAETDAEGISKVGSRVRVKVPLKVYHVPKVPEIDLTGKEGVIKQYVGVWKGKRISANYPFKVEFQAEVPERGAVKFSAHLREDELEFVD